LTIVSISQEKVPIPPKGVPAHLVAIPVFLMILNSKDKRYPQTLLMDEPN